MIQFSNYHFVIFRHVAYLSLFFFNFPCELWKMNVILVTNVILLLQNPNPSLDLSTSATFIGWMYSSGPMERGSLQERERGREREGNEHVQMLCGGLRVFWTVSKVRHSHTLEWSFWKMLWCMGDFLSARFPPSANRVDRGISAITNLP